MIRKILTSLNETDRWILALVSVTSDGGEEVRYVRRPSKAAPASSCSR